MSSSAPMIALLVVLGAAPAVAQTAGAEGSLLNRGKTELGLGVAGGYSNSSDRYGDNFNVSLNPSLFLGYMVSSALELRLVVLYQHGDQRSDGAVNTQDSAGGVAQALYDLSLPLGLIYYAGLGAGGIAGHVNEPPANSGTRIGGLGQLLTGILIQPGATLTIRLGVRSDFLIGDRWFGPMEVSVFNTQLLLETAIGAKF